MIPFVICLVILLTSVIDGAIVYDLSKSDTEKINTRSIVYQLIAVYSVIVIFSMYFTQHSHELFRSYVFTGCVYLTFGSMLSFCAEKPLPPGNLRSRVVVCTLCLINGGTILTTSAIGYVIYIAYAALFH